MDLTRSEMQKIVDEAPEGATHIISETYVKMNVDSVNSGWCKVWFNGKWMRNGYISNCTSLYEIREVLVSKAFKGAHVNADIVDIAFNVETPEEKEALDNIKVTKVGDKQSVKVETEHQKEMAEFGVEWKNGDECRYANDIDHEYIYIGEHPYGDGHYVISEEKGVTYISNGYLLKPESPEDKEERERLESAYDLYCIMCAIEGYAKFDLTDFAKTNKDSAVWLAIVDKTKYRKDK